MSINVKLLAEICEASGAPGHEQRIREIAQDPGATTTSTGVNDIDISGTDVTAASSITVA